MEIDKIVFDNYKKLCKTIKNTDKDNGKDSVWGLYDTKDDEKLIGIFNSCNSIAMFLRTSSNVIENQRSRKQSIRRRFIIEKIKLYKELKLCDDLNLY